MELLKLLESLRTPFLDSAVGAVTHLGDELFVTVLMLAIFWCVDKRAAYIIGTAFFLAGITVQGMKIFFRVDRPWVIDPGFSPVPSAMEKATGYSFPSGHTQSAATIFGSFGVLAKRKYVKAVCFAVPFLVAFSRMYLGVHTLRDVAASLAISALFIFISFKSMGGGRARSKKSSGLALSLFVAAYSAAVLAVALMLFSQGKIGEQYLSDSLKAAGAGLGFAIGFYIERNFIRFSVETRSFFSQLLKLACGLAGTFAILEGMKLIPGAGLAADIARYFLVAMWAFVFFPLIIRRFFQAPRSE